MLACTSSAVCTSHAVGPRRSATTVGVEQPHPHLPDRLGREDLEVVAELLLLRHAQPGEPRRADRRRATPRRSPLDRDDVAREVPRAVEAEVHAQPQPVVELEEHLLADGLRLHDRVAVEQGGVGREPALRRGDRDGHPDEMARELARDPVDGMTLGHAVDLVAGDRARRLELGELGDAARVALLVRERRREERVDEPDRLVERVLPRADRDQVRVVVLAGQLGGRGAPDQGGASAGPPCWPPSPRRCPSRRTRRRAPRCPPAGRATTALAALMQKLG